MRAGEETPLGVVGDGVMSPEQFKFESLKGATGQGRLGCQGQDKKGGWTVEE